MSNTCLNIMLIIGLFIVSEKSCICAFKSYCCTINTKLVRLGVEWEGVEGAPLLC